MIGRCWADKNIVAGNTAVLWDPWVGCSKKAWKTAPPDVRQGFRHKNSRPLPESTKAWCASQSS
jgi:hypothetical protein